MRILYKQFSNHKPQITKNILKTKIRIPSRFMHLHFCAISLAVTLKTNDLPKNLF